MERGRLTVRYGEKRVTAQRGQTLLAAILAAGEDHRHICGARGFCTSCRVEVIGSPAGLSPVSPLERQRLGGQAGTLRLACQTQLIGDVEVRCPVPGRGRFSPDGHQ